MKYEAINLHSSWPRC